MIDFFTRLDKYMEHKDLNDNKITVEAGVSNGLIGKARKKGGALSLENILKILYTYSDLSAEWLLRGKGDMLINSTDQFSENKTDKEIIPLLLGRIEELSKEIGRLEQNNKKSIDHTDVEDVACVDAVG